MTLGKSITIIGGSGGMGKVFGKYFQEHGFVVTFYARNEHKLRKAATELNVKFDLSLEKSVRNADIVMISIPINSTPDMIRKVGPFLKKNALIFDVTSLKCAVFNALTEIKNKFPVNCISLHPMFGPGISDMKNYVMMVLKVGGTDRYEVVISELLELFRSDGLIITETLPEIHDKRVALTLGVPHMINILFLNLLKSTKEPLNELTRFTGTTFLLQKVFAESIIQREMEMFGEIQMENQEFLKILELFESLLHKYKKIIAEKNIIGFNELFSQGLDYSKEDNHFENSYNYFYEFMKILKKESEN
ncbi:MAG: prephenate dehydrogenase/arogenate dehydrogenase family protein [Candidatus Lokiarchaeota archaeon]|nr:prephenate dehydrogenase/arogenate dehydrogenase family protein [Candidatus Lokiarchaeota archaeon]